MYTYDAPLQSIESKLAIIAKLDDLQRPIGGAGFGAAVIALAKTSGWFIGGFLASLIVTLLIGADPNASFGPFQVLMIIASGALMYKTWCRRWSPSVDARRLAHAAVTTLDDFLDPDSPAEIWATPPRGFSLRVTTGGEETIMVTLEDRFTCVAELRLADEVVERFEHTAQEKKSAKATDELIARLRSWLAKTLRTRHPIKGASTAPVVLRSPEGSPDSTPKNDLEFSAQHYEATPPSRIVARAATLIYQLLFVAISLSVMFMFVLIAVAPGSPGFNPMSVFGPMALLLAASIAHVHLHSRPVNTSHHDAIPALSTTYQLSDTALSSHLTHDPEDRVTIDLQSPFASTFTRSVEGIEPPRVTLELRQVRRGRQQRFTIGALIGEGTDPDILEALRPWGADALALEAEAFSELCEVIDFYARAHGQGLKWSAAPAA